MNSTSCPTVKHVAVDSTQNSTISYAGTCKSPSRIKNFATLYAVMFFQNVKMTYEVFTAKIFFWW
jgi:hypothetical protein